MRSFNAYTVSHILNAMFHIKFRQSKDGGNFCMIKFFVLIKATLCGYRMVRKKVNVLHQIFGLRIYEKCYRMRKKKQYATPLNSNYFEMLFFIEINQLLQLNFLLLLLIRSSPDCSVRV